MIVGRDALLTRGSYDYINKNRLFKWSTRDSAIKIISKLIKNLESRKPISQEAFVNNDSVIKLENFLKSRNLISNKEKNKTKFDIDNFEENPEPETSKKLECKPIKDFYLLSDDDHLFL